MQPNFLTMLKILGLSLFYLSCQNIIGDDNQLKSGVEGTVLRGPMCPGPVSEANPCPDQPFSAIFHVFNDQGDEVTKFQSDAQGDFRVGMSAGEYTIIPDESAPIIYPTGQLKNVVVQDHQYTKVTLEFDTGIR